MRLKEYLEESGYSRIMQIISGLVPTVKSFAVITWENPLGKKMSDGFNKKANKELKDFLKQGNYSFKSIKGRYNDFENPFIIFNINLSQAKQIGFEYDKYKQDSIIFAKNFSNNNEKGITIKMIFNNNRKPLVRRVWKSLNKDTKDFYSEYNGRKFQIPFFDDETKNFRFKDGKKAIIESFNIYDRNKFTNSVVQSVDDIMKENLSEDISGKKSYINRGIVKNMLERNISEEYLRRIKSTIPGKGNIEIFINPTQRDRKDIGDTIRFTVDEDSKKVYAWGYDKAFHADVSKALGIKHSYNNPNRVTGSAVWINNKYVFNASDAFKDFKRMCNETWVEELLNKDWSWADKYIEITPFINKLKEYKDKLK